MAQRRRICNADTEYRGTRKGPNMRNFVVQYRFNVMRGRKNGRFILKQKTKDVNS